MTAESTSSNADNARGPDFGGRFGFAPGFGGNSRASAAFTRAHRFYASWRATPSWAKKTLGTLVLIVLMGLAAVLLVVGLLVGAVVAVFAAAVIGVRAAWARLTGNRQQRNKQEAGLDAMRSNVRVIARDPGSN
ncbi:MAG: hypothetical protein ACKVZJ_08890 [Phycisphaerales bacterium]